jgi:oligopeptide transport system ATP-binding protein
VQWDGSVRFQGQELLQLPERDMLAVRGRRIAMVFQDPMTSLNPVITIGRQLMEPLRVHLGMDEETAKERAIDLLSQVGIPEPRQRITEYPHQFSGGMRQRAMIAMSLACAPSLLIADEPTTALDVTIQSQIVELVERLRDELGMAVIWITHDLGVVAGIAERVAVMYAGFIVEEASVDDVYEHPSHPYTLALLEALPRIDRRRDKRLKSIPGAPPNLLVAPNGCPFAPRCEYTFERCYAENPVLELIAPNHKIACWLDVTTGKPR